MKIDMKKKIIDSAIELFSKKPYEKVSVTWICKNANISNGVIYIYFKNKEELFKYLLKETCIKIEKQFQNIKGNTIRKKLENFIYLNIDITKKEFLLIKIYREGQYIFIEYEQLLRKVYLRALHSVYNRELEEIEYLFIISGIRYININCVKQNLKVNEKFLAEILLNGFFKKSNLKIDTLSNIDLYLRVLFNNENNKHRLLNVGEQLFGNKGYFKVKINEITEKSDISIGGFYNLFKNKEKFLHQMIENSSKVILNFLIDNKQKKFDQTETHILFLYLLLEFYENSPYKYKLLREAEFISKNRIEQHNKSLENLYMKTLEGLSYSREEKRLISLTLLGIAHYMGIEFFFTKNIKNKVEFLKKMKHYFSNGLSK